MSDLAQLGLVDLVQHGTREIPHDVDGTGDLEVGKSLRACGFYFRRERVALLPGDHEGHRDLVLRRGRANGHRRVWGVGVPYYRMRDGRGHAPPADRLDAERAVERHVAHAAAE